MMKHSGLMKLAHILLWVGGLNWGFVGLFDANLVGLILGSAPILERLVYILVGISAIVVLFGCKACCGPMKGKK